MSQSTTRDLELLADMFKSGGWREIRVEANGINVLFSTDTMTASLGHTAPLASVATAVLTAPAIPEPSPIPTSPAQASIAAHWHAVTAPNLGTFYRSPKPGSPPFVELGQRVNADTEICLLEVMKLFTSVKAGVAGTVRRIDATDAELVEGGQMLFHIEPE